MTRHVLWGGRGKVHAIRPPQYAYEWARPDCGTTWCSLYGSFVQSFEITHAPLTCKTCIKREAARATA